MLRKLTIVLCLITFAPVAVGAQGLAAVAAQQAAGVPSTEKTMPSKGEINLSLPAERSATVLMAATETPQGATVENAEEQKREPRRAHSWNNFVEVHFGDYRWVWWAGAAAILIGIHVAAVKD